MKVPVKVPGRADETGFESAIYQGHVRHRRFTPRNHEFDYSLFMMLLKVDEIPRLLKTFWQLGSGPLCWARFRRADYAGDTQQDLGEAVRHKMAELLNMEAASLEGDVFILCQLRYLGFYFSPLNLYYLRQQGEYRYMLAEVSNTPWNERHYYLQDLRNPTSHAKQFHVSPFNPMNQRYTWRLTPPDPTHGRCLVHIDCSSAGDNPGKVFDATLSMRRRELNQKELNRVLLRTPAQTLSVMAGIYWQAAKLFIKRTPVYGHPGKDARPMESTKRWKAKS